jgi:hypothetical protein
LIIKTPSGVFSSRKLTKPKEKKGGLRLIRKDAPLEKSLPQLPFQETAAEEEEEQEQEACARCRIYKKKEIKVREIIFVYFIYLFIFTPRRGYSTAYFHSPIFHTILPKSNNVFQLLVVKLHQYVDYDQRDWTDMNKLGVISAPHLITFV